MKSKSNALVSEPNAFVRRGLKLSFLCSSSKKK